jgi:hypothetical protein
VQRKAKKIFSEGNLYNTEEQILGMKNPTEDGLYRWKQEVLKQLYSKLKRKTIPNIQPLKDSVFGETLK